MSKRRWTFVIVPPGSEASRVVEVSQTVLKAVGAAALVFALLATGLGYSTYSRSLHLSHTDQLERENQQINAALLQMSGRLDTLTDTLSVIAQRDSRVRLLANLEPVDPQVLEAGIGGPARGPADVPRSQAERKAASLRVDLNALLRKANILAASFKETADSLEQHSRRLASIPSIMPTQGWLSSAFSSMRQHPILHIARPHEGIDVTADMGAPIEAPAAGVVIAARWENGYGNTLEIDHGYGIVTRFAHASKLLVHKGERVTRGQKIALVGNTGLATGPHLHYEVHVNGRPVDPLKYVLPDAIVD
ncbi:MAG: M23 family metallopeptidase [Gemmatimonadales bacterium]